jgi:hypothetical protein
MQFKFQRLLFLTLSLAVITSCGKKKDRADLLRVSVIHPSGQQDVLPNGVKVQVYAQSGELYLEGLTNESNNDLLGATSITFSPADRLVGDNERLEEISHVLVTLGDSISNIDGDQDYWSDNDVYVSTDFNIKQTDDQTLSIGTHRSYFGLLSNSNWLLVNAYINGTSSGLVSCASDNTLSFGEFNVANPEYSEGADVCPNGDGSVAINTPMNFNNSTINGSSSKSSSASGFLRFDSDQVTLSAVHIIYPDTLVIRGESGGNIFDYYFAKQ